MTKDSRLLAVSPCAPKVPEEGVEPTRPYRTLDFESSASANSATLAKASVVGVRGELSTNTDRDQV